MCKSVLLMLENNRKNKLCIIFFLLIYMWLFKSKEKSLNANETWASHARSWGKHYKWILCWWRAISITTTLKMSFKGHNTATRSAAQWVPKALSVTFFFQSYSLISLHGIITHLMSWNNVIIKLAQTILPWRYYNIRRPIVQSCSKMFSLAHSHSLDIFHLLPVNPLAAVKGQLA